jgi:hypothetical protein
VFGAALAGIVHAMEQLPDGVFQFVQSSERPLPVAVLRPGVLRRAREDGLITGSSTLTDFNPDYSPGTPHPRQQRSRRDPFEPGAQFDDRAGRPLATPRSRNAAPVEFGGCR